MWGVKNGYIHDSYRIHPLDTSFLDNYEAWLINCVAHCISVHLIDGQIFRGKDSIRIPYLHERGHEKLNRYLTHVRQ